MKAEFFESNRRKLHELAKVNGPIVVCANGLLQRNGDNVFPFRQDSSFFYLTGVNEPDLILVIDNSGDYLIVPGRDINRVNFDGAVKFDKLKLTSGVSEILDEKAGWQRLKLTLGKVNTAATLFATPSFERRHGFYANPARARLIRKLKAVNSKIKLTDIRPELAKMRMIKQPAELTEIQNAIDITAAGLKKVNAKLTSYKYEYEIEAELTAFFRKSGAAGHAFSPIVAGGKNACTLHNVNNGSKLTSGEFVLLDVGAEANNYAGDLTRTFAFGEVSGRQKEVFNAVLRVQNFALTLLKPGINLKDYEQKVAEFMGEQLKELGLIKKVNGIKEQEIRKYYPHATGHFLGLDAHDAGDYSQPLTENVVLTVEPGIYIPEEKIGVRIEDDILITKSGNRVLSANLPRELR